MKKKSSAVIALVAGVAMALSVSLPASATTISTGAKTCSASYDKQKSYAKYSVEHKIVSNLDGGEYGASYSNGNTYTTRTTLWSGAYWTFVNSASSSWANGAYLSTSSIYC